MAVSIYLIKSMFKKRKKVVVFTVAIGKPFGLLWRCSKRKLTVLILGETITGEKIQRSWIDETKFSADQQGIVFLF